MKRYFVWKDANCNGINPEWLEISGEEFMKLKANEPKRRFIPCYDEDDPESDVFLYEATKENYNEWNRDQMRYHYRDAVFHQKYKFVSLDDLVSEDDEEGLTWAEVIPNTSEEDAAAHEAFIDWKEEKLALIKDLLKEIDEEEYALLWNLIMNPKKEERMTEKAYAEKLGISQQAVHKRKKKLLDKFRDRLGC